MSVPTNVLGQAFVSWGHMRRLLCLCRGCSERSTDTWAFHEKENRGCNGEANENTETPTNKQARYYLNSRLVEELVVMMLTSTPRAAACCGLWSPLVFTQVIA